MMPRGPVTFIGMQERLAGPPLPLFNTANGHTLTEDGLRKHGLAVPAAEIRADLLELAVRHYRAAFLAERLSGASSRLHKHAAKQAAQAEAIAERVQH